VIKTRARSGHGTGTDYATMIEMTTDSPRETFPTSSSLPECLYLVVHAPYVRRLVFVPVGNILEFAAPCDVLIAESKIETPAEHAHRGKAALR
jgi:hypothetical protein